MSLRDRLGSGRRALREVFWRLMHEGLAPGPAAAAVALGVTFGIIPIYGFQAVTAVALATVLGLNRPLTLAATFINNPLLQPFLVVGSIEIGSLVLRGSMVPLSAASFTPAELARLILPWFVGSVVMSAILGAAAAAVTFGVVARFSPTYRIARERERAFRRWLAERYQGTSQYARGFVRWKTRLDRMFALLLAEDLGTGPVVDLGCGHGTALSLAAFRDPGRTLHGCDLDAGRIEAASIALAPFDAHLAVADIRSFPLPPAGLILILDVLQYIPPADQRALLQRCADAILPGGRLIFRLPDTRRGVLTWTTKMLDRIILWMARSKAAAEHTPPHEALQALLDAGWSVESRSDRNRLPLAHVLTSARKPGAA